MRRWCPSSVERNRTQEHICQGMATECEWCWNLGQTSTPSLSCQISFPLFLLYYMFSLLWLEQVWYRTCHRTFLPSPSLVIHPELLELSVKSSTLRQGNWQSTSTNKCLTVSNMLCQSSAKGSSPLLAQNSLKCSFQSTDMLPVFFLVWVAFLGNALSHCLHTAHASEDRILFWFSIFTDGVASVYINTHKNIYVYIWAIPDPKETGNYWLLWDQSNLVKWKVPQFMEEDLGTECFYFNVLSNPNYSMMCLNYVIHLFCQSTTKTPGERWYPLEEVGAEHLSHPVCCHRCPPVTGQAYNEDLVY